VKANAGLRPQIDTYVMQAEIERAQLDLTDARNSYSDAKVALDNALGLSDRAPNYHLEEATVYSSLNDTLDVLIQKAMQRRPDLKAIQNQANAMGATIDEFKSDYYPTVNAVAGYAAMGTGTPTVNNINAGIVISWPLFNSFLTTDQIAETKLRRRSLEDAIADLRQRIIIQVQTAFLDWQASMQRIEFARRHCLRPASSCSLPRSAIKRDCQISLSWKMYNDTLQMTTRHTPMLYTIFLLQRPWLIRRPLALLRILECKAWNEVVADRVKTLSSAKRVRR
jgi:hypothetical protein